MRKRSSPNAGRSYTDQASWIAALAAATTLSAVDDRRPCKHGAGGRGPEVIEPDKGALRVPVLVPTLLDAGLDSYAGRHARRQHLLAR